MREFLTILLIVGLSVAGVAVVTRTFDVDAQGRPMSIYRDASQSIPGDTTDGPDPAWWPHETPRDEADRQLATPRLEALEQVPTPGAPRSPVPTGA